MLSVPQMSFYGGVLVVAVLLVRKLAAGRLPRATFVFLWGVTLCRLLLPVRLASPFSVYRAMEPLGELPRRTGMLAAPGAAVVETAAGPRDVAWIWPSLWAAGVLLLAAYFLLSHALGLRRYRASLPVDHPFVTQWLAEHGLGRSVRVRCSDQIASPLTYGVLRPVILLPRQMDWDNEQLLAFVLAHELAHIRRFDTLMKWALAAAVCVHWFNPLVWVLYITAGRDIELACDEAVMRRFGLGARASYARALVTMEEKRTLCAPLGSAFSRAPLKERVLAVMKARPFTAASTAAGLVLLLAVAVVFGTASPTMPAAVPVTQTAVQELTAKANTLPGSAGQEDWEQQYRRLLDALQPENYETLSIAQFNRSVYAAFQDDDGQNDLMELYERVLMDLPQNDPNALFLTNTVWASLEEYTARLQEVYDHRRNDPVLYGNAQTMVTMGREETMELWASCSFTYRILDQDALTVAERDAFLQQLLQLAQDTLRQQWESKQSLQGYPAALAEKALALSNDRIACTGCVVENTASPENYGLFKDYNKEFL